MTIRCLHCNEKTMQHFDFCCIGCMHAYNLIHTLHMDQFYEYCKNIYKTNPSTVFSNNDLNITSNITQNSKSSGLYFNYDIYQAASYNCINLPYYFTIISILRSSNLKITFQLFCYANAYYYNSIQNELKILSSQIDDQVQSYSVKDLSQQQVELLNYIDYIKTTTTTTTNTANIHSKFLPSSHNDQLTSLNTKNAIPEYTTFIKKENIEDDMEDENKKYYKINDKKKYNQSGDYTSDDSNHDEVHEIRCLIYGIKCGACIWLIENALQRIKNIIQARINMSTKRILIIWTGNTTDILQFVSLLKNLGYDLTPYTEIGTNQASTHHKYMLKCLAISGVVWLQNMMITMGIWAGHSSHDLGIYTRYIMNIIATIITLPGIYYAGMPFFKSAINAIKAKSTNMDIPISIGVIATIFISIEETILGSNYVYYESASGLIFALLIGKYLESQIRNKAYSKIETLLTYQCTIINILNADNTIKPISVKKAQLGDKVLIASSEKILVDGTVCKGISQVDNSIITGESKPIEVKIGDNVYAGTMNITNPIQVLITAIAEETILAKITNLIEIAEKGKNKYLQMAEKVARIYTPIILTLSFFTIIFWLITLVIFDMFKEHNVNNSAFYTACMYGASVLIITCPCALGLSIPIAQVLACTKLINRGIIVKSSDALEKINDIDTIVFDKTGLLTLGKPTLLNRVAFVEQLNQISKKLNLNIGKILTDLAKQSKHILCKAICEANIVINDQHILNSEACKDILSNATITEFSGRGIELKYKKSINSLYSNKFGTNNFLNDHVNDRVDIHHIINELKIRIGSRKFVSDINENALVGSLILPSLSQSSLSSSLSPLETFIIIIWRSANNVQPIEPIDYNNQTICFQLHFSDAIRPNVQHVIQYMKNLNLKMVILSGDNEYNTATIANNLSIANYFSNLTPHEKYQYVQNLVINGSKVFMLGDGMNDAAAMKSANVSCSPVTATDITKANADIVFQSDDFMDIKFIMHIARKSQIIMKQNIVISLLYNVIAVPIAMCGFTTPIIAAFMMATSSIVVVLNSLRISKL